MKLTWLQLRIIPFVALVLSASLTFMPAAAHAGDIYVTNLWGTIGQYDSSGTLVNASLASGLSNPAGIALTGANLLVANQWNGTVAEYSATTGAPVNGGTLISGLNDPVGLAVAGADLFVVNAGNSAIDEYTTSGTLVKASLITGLSAPQGLTVSGSDLFVANYGAGTVGEYTTAGTLVKTISGLGWGVQDVAVSGSDLFVTNAYANTISKYDLSGATVTGGTLISSGLSTPWGIAVSGSDLFVTNFGNGTIGEYDASTGSTVNIFPVFYGQYSNPQGIVVADNGGGGGGGAGSNGDIGGQVAPAPAVIWSLPCLLGVFGLITRLRARKMPV